MTEDEHREIEEIAQELPHIAYVILKRVTHKIREYCMHCPICSEEARVRSARKVMTRETFERLHRCTQ